MNRTRFSMLFLLLCFFWQLHSQINPCNWKFRKRITFDPAKVSGSTDLTDFPALITFTADPDLEQVGNGGGVEHQDGYDIMFTAADGITQLSHDLCFYRKQTGELTVWVKVPTLSTSLNTYIYLYYGNASITTDQSSKSTWSNGYVGVWHLDNALTNSTTVSGLDGTNNGSSNSSPAKIFDGRRFQRSSSEYVDVTPYNSAYDLTGDVTVSCWLNLNSTGVDQKVAGNQNNVNGGYKLSVLADNKIDFEIRTSGNTAFQSSSASGGASLTTATWYYIVGQYSDAGNFIKTYRNGTIDRNYVTAGVLGTSAGTLKFGRQPYASAAHLDGVVDELHISNVERSADWIATEYENQNSPATFYTVSPTPKVWDASSNGAWGTGLNWTPAGVPATMEDILIPNPIPARQPTLNTSVDIASLWVQSGSSLNLGANSRTLGIAFDILNCGVITGSLGVLKLNGTNIQTQHISGTGTYSLCDLMINNQFALSPTTQLNRSVTIGGALKLSSSIVATTTTNILAMDINATSTSGSSQSFVSGPMSKAGTTDFVFPVGKGQEWRRIRVSSISASTTFRAEYFTTAYPTTTPVTAPLDNVSQVEFWQLDRTTGSGNANVSLYWENVAYSGIDDCADLEIARWNGSSWVRHDATTVTASSCSGSGTGTILTNAVVTAFSPFTFGSTSTLVNALPIQLSNFEYNCQGAGILLSWTTQTELNNAEFVIERSSNGLSFAEAGRIKGAGYSKTEKTYTFRDDHFASETTYFRLRMVDAFGETTFSHMISAPCPPGSDITVYPNPGNGDFTIRGMKNDMHFRVVNALGQTVINEMASGPFHSIHIQVQGLYVLYFPESSETPSIKLIVR